MGIREYFEKHPVKDLKLHDLDLGIEKKEETLNFDPETDITSQDWEAIQKHLEVLRQQNWEKFYESVIALKVFFPERIDKTKFNDQDWENAKKVIAEKESSKKEDFDEFLKELIRAKLVFPNRFQEIKLNNNLEQEIIERIKSQIEKDALPDELIYLKILFPKTKCEPNSKDLNRQKIKDDIEYKRKENLWISFSDLLFCIKCLFPDEFDEFKITEQDWQQMLNRLAKERKEEDWQGFLELAGYLTAISAAEVKITEKGIQLTPRKEDIKQSKKPRPVRKKF